MMSIKRPALEHPDRADGGKPPGTEAAALRQAEAMGVRLRRVLQESEWRLHAPYVAEILKLKAERRAVILAHNYQTPEIFHAVADLTGDSLALARMAADTDADVIVMCGVHFMAETAKLLNPFKTVLIPDPEAGCSLASSITAEDVRLLRRRFPGVPVVTYINTSAAVKAESDICCTSGNAVEIVASLGADRVLFLPDEYLGRYVASRTRVDVLLWKGHCEVHEKFTADELKACRQKHPGVILLAHPECPPDVLAEVDFVGSTAAMVPEIERRKAARVLMVTECSMSDNVAVDFPDIEFVRPPHECPHMKRITLPKILHSLQSMQYVVDVDPGVAERARLAVRRMLDPAPLSLHSYAR